MQSRKKRKAASMTSELAPLTPHWGLSSCHKEVHSTPFPSLFNVYRHLLCLRSGVPRFPIQHDPACLSCGKAWVCQWARSSPSLREPGVLPIQDLEQDQSQKAFPPWLKRPRSMKIIYSLQIITYKFVETQSGGAWHRISQHCMPLPISSDQ